MNRHLAQCHKELSKEGREKLLVLHADLLKKNKNVQALEIEIKEGNLTIRIQEDKKNRKKFVRKIRKCMLCQQNSKYLYSHLQYVHKLKKDDPEYIRILKEVSFCVNNYPNNNMK